MKNNAITIEQNLKASVTTVWKAITNKDDMEHWYFEIDEFKPETGFRFSFYGGDEEQKFLHECQILDVEVNRRLSYSWRYPDLDGDSVVTFELFSKNTGHTLLILTHDGIETFPQDNPLFSRESFQNGWNEILGTYLKEYVENQDS